MMKLPVLVVITAALLISIHDGRAEGITMRPLDAENSVRPQILNGRPAEASDWPVTLQFVSAGGFCTSTIVGDQVLITAAHCLPNNSEATVVFNNESFKAICSHHKEYRGEACLSARKPREVKGCTADIALCRTERPFKTSTPANTKIRFESIGPERSAVTAGKKVTLLGYGCVEEGGSVQDSLQIGETPVVSLSMPGASANPDNTMSEYIITRGGAAVCSGDSGGSAYSNAGLSTRKIVAINSRGNMTTTSYLTSVSDQHILDFLKGWVTPICGIHQNAKGC